MTARPGRPASPTVSATADGSGWAPAPVPATARWGLHLLVAVLLVLAAVRAAANRPTGWPWVVAWVAVVGVVYAVGPHSTRVSTSRRGAAAWLTVLLGTWVVLLALTPDAIYLAFAWFLLLLHLLPRTAGLVAVAATTVAAVAGFAWHQGRLDAAMVIGPVLGAAVATATVLGYQALQAESERRRVLIVELARTRDELAAAQRRAGVLDERERLAREIHDTLAQGLTSIQLLLRATTRSLDPERGVDVGRAATLTEQARETAQENLAEARRFVRDLAPGDLEASSLAGALRRLCETTSSRGSLPVAFHEVGAAEPLPTPVEVALLRIAQSALGNTIQHSHAGRADVTLTTMDSEVTLDVVDDGVGFVAGRAEADDLQSAVPDSPDRRAPNGRAEAPGGGFGLRSMRSRAAELGGLLTVESRPGHGTAVSVRFPRSSGPVS
ncbi:sensor histidine kinase [Phycicoccus ginsengisoli]